MQRLDDHTDAVAFADACPHCHARMTAHDSPPGTPKHGAWHCDACGSCWVKDESGWRLRDGHPAPAGWGGPAPPGQG